MSESDSQPQEGVAPGAPDPPRLRRAAFGYRRSDVDEALRTRDAQLTELRQDIAALWLAFAQHDRALRALDPGSKPADREAGSTPANGDEVPDGSDDSTRALGQQLAGLDEALAAIEAATHTLERSYANEINGPEGPAERPGDERPPG